MHNVVRLKGGDTRSGWGMSNFRQVDRQTGFLLPPSVDEWLPERHLARFVVEVVEGLDLRALIGSYRGSGSASYHPGVVDRRPLPLGFISEQHEVRGYRQNTRGRARVKRATFENGDRTRNSVCDLYRRSE